MLLPALAACTPAVLDPRGPVGAANRTLLFDALAIMLVIVVPVIVATLCVAWWFRAGNARARYRPTWAFSGQIEMVVWAIPLMTILLLGGVAWIGAHRLDPAVPLEGGSSPPLEIQVVSLDWKWLFIYPKQGVASVNRLVVPAGSSVHFLLTSSSVMNTFFVPQLGSMIYTMNGMETQLHLRADQPGTLRGISGHYSGAGFADMHFDVEALPAAEFANWAASAKASGPVLDADTYTALAKQSMNVAPMNYSSVDPMLFAAIVAQRVPPGPGPAASAGMQVVQSSGSR